MQHADQLAELAEVVLAPEGDLPGGEEGDEHLQLYVRDLLDIERMM